MDDDWDLQAQDYNYMDEKDVELEQFKVERRSKEVDKEDTTENVAESKVVKDNSFFCSSCGNKIMASSDECIYCGTPIKEKNTTYLFIMMWSFVLIGQLLMLVGHLLWEFNTLDNFGPYLASFILTFIGSLLHLGFVPCGILYIIHSKDKKKAFYLFICLAILTIMALVMGFVKLYLMIIFKPIFDSAKLV